MGEMIFGPDGMEPIFMPGAKAVALERKVAATDLSLSSKRRAEMKVQQRHAIVQSLKNAAKWTSGTFSGSELASARSSLGG